MNLQQATTLGTKKLNHLDNPKLEAEVLLCQLINCDRTHLKIHPTQALTLKQQLYYRYCLHQRSNHIPTAYISGQKTWNGLLIKVNKHTLIPRDETEILCYHIKDHQPETPESILDVGTGSGCIAVWLKQQYPPTKVTALELSSSALKVAQINALALNAEIEFKHSDLLNAVERKTHFDLIVANLPYVPSQTVMTQEVLKEPTSAIVSGSDGLNHIRQLAQQLKTKHITFNQLWLEFLPSQTDDIKSIFAAYQVEFLPDASGQLFFAKVT